ncbi:hypothetical protein [Clostridium hydrogeniformans]|uniref:hypothetical protein n=1 Tax=Clostridium hydrogeniformans TaxID=349933 RepID=UPI00047FCD52|nr:hypothetical protein [Clostridium hydrogeniformans]
MKNKLIEIDNIEEMKNKREELIMFFIASVILMTVMTFLPYRYYNTSNAKTLKDLGFSINSNLFRITIFMFVITGSIVSLFTFIETFMWKRVRIRKECRELAVTLIILNTFILFLLNS